MGGDLGEVYAAAAVLNHEQDVEEAQEDGVDVGEVEATTYAAYAPTASPSCGCPKLGTSRDLLILVE
jgi:hypothetical protein